MRTTQEITDEVNYLADRGLTPRVSTQLERAAEVNSIVVAEAKEYLRSTDWVVAKIGEVLIKGQDTAPLMAQYEEVLTKRQEARGVINEYV